MRRGRQPGIDDVYSAVERVGWVQIDTLQVVRRAQYLTLWSRLGTYDPDHLDSLLFDDGSTLVRQRPTSVRVLDARRLHHPADPVPLSHAD